MVGIGRNHACELEWGGEERESQGNHRLLRFRSFLFI